MQRSTGYWLCPTNITNNQSVHCVSCWILVTKTMIRIIGMLSLFYGHSNLKHVSLCFLNCSSLRKHKMSSVSWLSSLLKNSLFYHNNRIMMIASSCNLWKDIQPSNIQKIVRLIYWCGTCWKVRGDLTWPMKSLASTSKLKFNLWDSIWNLIMAIVMLK